MKLETLKTPSLVLDIAKVKRNAERMSQRIKQFGADLRPHIKTHKCIEVARIQTAGHSGAVTVVALMVCRGYYRSTSLADRIPCGLESPECIAWLFGFDR
jgi:D-serine deaminase-like pyridoxal phosphate-dependent protein